MSWLLNLLPGFSRDLTEAEWLACTDPQRLQSFLKRKVSDRKLRLVEEATRLNAWRTWTTAADADKGAAWDAWTADGMRPNLNVWGTEGQRSVTDLVRHIIGNPFRPYPVASSWPSCVRQLAASLYDGQECAFALHDVLLEASHVELAEHFQNEEWHPQGCWALDVILGNH